MRRPIISSSSVHSSHVSSRPTATRALRRAATQWFIEALEQRVLLAVNPIVTENQLAGTPQSTWDVSGSGDSTILGFSTDISVNAGQTISFKVNDTANASYHIDIYRMG